MMFGVGCTPDKNTPDKGVTVTMSSNIDGVNCSLSVSIVCDKNSVKVRLLPCF